MVQFLPNRAFTEIQGKVYFHREKRGPTYEVNWAERENLIALMQRFHFLMATVIFGFVLILAVAIVFLPVILSLDFFAALVILFLMAVLALLPFLLMVKFHLDFQKDVRKVLGGRLAVEFVFPRKVKSPEEIKKETVFRFVAVFLLGIVVTTVGITMLIAPDYLPFKFKLIWTMAVVTGLTLIGVGIAGLVLRMRNS